MYTKISIICLFTILLISGAAVPSIAFGQFSDLVEPDYVIPSDCIVLDESITVSLDKESYSVGEEIKISGQVIPKAAAYSSDITRNYVYITFPDVKSLFIVPTKDLDSQPTSEAYNPSRASQSTSLSTLDTKTAIDECGFFNATLKLHPIVFTNGYYILDFKYADSQIEKDILVFDDSLQRGCFTTDVIDATLSCDDAVSILPEINLEIQKNEYLPGEKVKISGYINDIIYNDNIELILQFPTSSENLNEELQKESKLFKFINTKEPTFFWNYKLKTGAESIGNYSVSVVTHLGTVTKFFTVNDESIVTDYAAQKSISQKKIIDKFNRITDSKIEISLSEKTSGEQTLLPRVLQGSLFTVARGEEPSVNMQVSSSTGQCVIGQNADCMVNDSTRKSDSIYELVQIDGKNYKVRYSGPDVRLEKFTIIPEMINTEINTKNWNVTVLKDDQPTKFYYKVSYVVIE